MTENNFKADNKAFAKNQINREIDTILTKIDTILEENDESNRPCKCHSKCKTICQSNIKDNIIIINTPGNYCLGEDLVFNTPHDPSSTAILINSPDVNLNLNQHVINGTKIVRFGIRVLGNNITISNGIIENFSQTGMFLIAGDNITLTSLKIINIIGLERLTFITGIFAQTIRNFTIDNCLIDTITSEFANNSMDGLRIEFGSNLIMKDCIIRNCTGGLQISGISILRTVGIKMVNITINSITKFQPFERIDETKGINLNGCLEFNLSGINIYGVIGETSRVVGIQITGNGESMPLITALSVIENCNVAYISCPKGDFLTFAMGIRCHQHPRLNVINSNVFNVISKGDGQAFGFADSNSTIIYNNCIASSISAIATATGFGFDIYSFFSDQHSLDIIFNACIAENCLGNKGIGFDLFRHLNCLYNNCITKSNNYGILNDGPVTNPNDPVSTVPNDSRNNTIKNIIATNNTESGILDTTNKNTYISSTIT
ncbi:MAG: hypothetical protein Hyperionvirus36_23 [Hyperionvirus sp.]|uniref:Right handed beta helix domain-containing protein n=1 Tax=Hyperionvirus sp. TaxID=2487770 RepID=A0A3G5ABZ0_9VIRU|nr:MAG: hypothetical protein Hyperionvirus36_23 [Hyperionvirus sp.]